MSYILDALKRAETERDRERGAVPGLHTQYPMHSSAPRLSGVMNRSVWLVVAVSLTLVVLSVGFWFWRVSDSAPLAPATSLVPIPAKAEVPTVLMLPSETKLDNSGKPVSASAPDAAGNPHAAVPPPPPLPPPQSTPMLPSVPLLADLAQDIRSQIPKITISGSVYSEIPSQRRLLVNNLVLAHGNLITPELKLEEIQTHSSLFSFKGTRFRVAH